MTELEDQFDAADDAAESISAEEHLLDDVAAFDPAESLFEGEIAIPMAVAPPVDDAQKLRTALDLLGQLQQVGGDEVASAVQRIQEALEPIAREMRTPAAASTTTPTPTPASGDLELECEFDSVSDVLEGVFGGAAAIVESSVEDAVVMAPRAGAPADEPPAAPEPAPEPVAEPEPVAAEPAAEPTPAAAPEAEAEDLDRILASLGVEPSVEIERLPRDAPEPGACGSSSAPCVESKLDRLLARLREKVEPPVLLVLNGISLPVRFVPTTLRPAVDWFALSLVFWVPVVWVIALLI